jgi:hypothetical protein
MDKPSATPKDFFLWAGAMVALYWSVIAFLGLVFDYINYAFPNPLSYYPADPYQSSISYEMASIIVLFPLFVVLMRVIHRDIKNDPSRGQIWVRRWALFLTLFVAGATMAGDLIWVLTTFLNGTDLTISFLLKAALVFLVAAAGFMHFIADLWGYWEQYPERAHRVGYVVSVLALGVIVAGFFIVGTPMQAKLYRFDAQKISDLQMIQSQIVYYYQGKQKLPDGVAQLNDSISNFIVPVDPQTGTAYTYKVVAAHSFQLCASFNAESRVTDQYTAMSRPAVPYGVESKDINGNWQHAGGNQCFLRTIDPAFYPPLTDKVK